MWVLYHIQAEAGESPAAPNAFEVSPKGRAPVLSDLLDAFPLRTTGRFHVRCRVDHKTHGAMWLDMTQPNQPLPVVNQHIVAKILRLDHAAPSPLRLQRKTTREQKRDVDAPPRPPLSGERIFRPPAAGGGPPMGGEFSGGFSPTRADATSRTSRTPPPPSSQRSGQPPHGMPGSSSMPDLLF